MSEGPAEAPRRPRRRVLLDDADTCIELYVQPGRSDTVVITFDPLQQLVEQASFGKDFLLRQGVEVLAVRRRHEHFYQALGREAFMEAVAPRLRRYRRVVAYGSSLGAYAALYYCRDLRCQVIASSPRVSVHPVYGVPAWQQQVEFRHERFDAARRPTCLARIFYDPCDPIDRRYIEGEVLPAFASARVYRLPYSGHPSNHFLSEIGYIAPYVRAVVAGQPAPRLERCRKRDSATYLATLAQACAQRGKPRTAEALLARALILRPRSSLAWRVRGLNAILQGDEAAARAALARALELSPGDQLSRHWLDTLPAQVARARRPGGPTAMTDATSRPPPLPALSRLGIAFERIAGALGRGR